MISVNTNLFAFQIFWCVICFGLFYVDFKYSGLMLWNCILFSCVPLNFHFFLIFSHLSITDNRISFCFLLFLHLLKLVLWYICSTTIHILWAFKNDYAAVAIYQSIPIAWLCFSEAIYNCVVIQWFPRIGVVEVKFLSYNYIFTCVFLSVLSVFLVMHFESLLFGLNTLLIVLLLS